MRIFLAIIVVSALASAVEVDNKYGMHYTQHRTSVDTARQGMQERLSKLEQQTAYQRQFGASENYVAGCTTGCATGSNAGYSSRLSSSSSSQRNSANALDSDYVGVGVVSHNNYEDDESDVQQRVSSRYAARSGYEADNVQQRVATGGLSNIQSSAYRQSAASRSNYKSEHEEEEEEEEEEDVQRSVGAGYHDLTVNNDRYVASQSQRRAQQFQKESESRVTSSGRAAYVPVGSSSSTYRSTGSNAESQYTDARVVKPVPVGQFVSMTARPGTSTILAIPVSAQDQQRLYSSANRRDYQAGSDSSRTRVQSANQINYYPSYSSDRVSSSGVRSDSESTRTAAQIAAEKLRATEYSKSRYNEEEIDEDDTQQRITQGNIGTRVASSTAGGATNYQQGYTSTRVVPAFPVRTIESTSSQRTAEEREQRQFSQSRPTFTQRTTALSRNENEQSSDSQYSTVNRPVYSASRASENEGRTYGSSGTTYYTVPITSQSRTQIQGLNQQGLAQSQYQAGSAANTQYQSGSAAHTQYQAGSAQNRYQAAAAQNQYQAGSGATRNVLGGYQSYPSGSRVSGSTAQRGLDSRFNSQVLASRAEDLNVYMSESERLAKAQQSQIASSQRASSQASASEANRRTVNTANALDATAAQFVSSSNLANRLSEFDNIENLSGTGGFQRVKSWQKQSKWASGSEYGTDGNPKSYSMLSTAEAEKHNINGAETGYKAATTTLENDGKVSTYSIHTP